MPDWHPLSATDEPHAVNPVHILPPATRHALISDPKPREHGYGCGSRKRPKKPRIPRNIPQTNP